MSLTRSVVLSFIASYAAIPMEIDSQNPTYVGQIPVPFPAFATIADSAFYISSFDANPFGGKDYEYIIRDASSLMSTKTKANILVEKMNGNVVWPNVASKAPSFFGAKGVVIPGGFLTPGRQSGGLWFGKEDGTIIELFRSPDYFYHAVAFYDVNQDGKMDILTCRSNKGPGKGDMTWLEPINRDQPLGQWKETVIGKGCDTFFVLDDVNSDGKIDIVSAEFWGKKLTLIESKNGRFDNADELVFTTIDDAEGNYFSVQVVDVNGDGKKDILATNHVSKNGKVFAYEVPAVSSGKWIQHDIAIDFPLPPGLFQGAPGIAEAFYPTESTSGKPHILVSGDYNGKAYVLTPNKSDAWGYTKTVLHDCKSTCGGFAIGDVNGDGKKEMYILCYKADGYIATYTY